MSPERLWGAAFLLASGGYLWLAFHIRSFWSGDPLGPRAFPIVLGVALAAGGLGLLCAPPRTEGTSSRRLAAPLALWVLLVAYCLLLPRIGYPVATTLFLIVAAYLAGERSPVRLLCLSVLVATGLFLLFTRVLDIYLPPGVARFLG
ncbi:MAG: tripartite tricarboxylate transporter TctB family protein [Bacillota bacterium]|nr:tripartite tricarboxylate transporter TctB family protein [Bacillota bacterium]